MLCQQLRACRLCDAQFFFPELVSDSLADDGIANGFLELRSDMAISDCVWPVMLSAGPWAALVSPKGPPAVLWSIWFPS
jgi:hypothetical protein